MVFFALLCFVLKTSTIHSEAYLGHLVMYEDNREMKGMIRLSMWIIIVLEIQKIKLQRLSSFMDKVIYN